MSMRKMTGITAGAETTDADNLLRDVDPLTAPSYAGGNTIVEARPSGVIDRLDLTPTDRERLGIEAHETHTYIRNPDVWLSTELGDRMIEFEQTHPGARVPKDANGKPRRFGQDLVLVVYPREQKEAQDRINAQMANEYMANTEEGGGKHDGHFDMTDEEQLLDVAAANHERMHSEGMIGDNSKTSGYSLLDAESMYSEHQIEAEEAKFRVARRHQELDREQFHDLMTNKKQGRSGGSITSIPANVRPKNFMRKPA